MEVRATGAGTVLGERLRLRVLAADDVSDCVRSFRLVSADSTSLPRWEPGAHLDLELPSGLVRQYSLCGDPEDLDCYEIAVLREPESRGGSVELHDSVSVGDVLVARDQRNHFVLHEAPSYLFVAGGVGITPILPMVQAAEKRGVPWRLVYGGRSRGSMAFLDRVVELGAETGRVDVVTEDERGLPDLGSELAATAPDAFVYACGPEGLLRAMESVCDDAGRRSSLRLERFGSSGDGPVSTADDTSFEVELAVTGAVLRVPAGTTVLEAVREFVPGQPSSCEEGFCGTCETRVLSGAVDHRDTLLSDDERAANDTMMICVSRASCPRLVLEL